VLYVPPGTYTLTERLTITNSRVVLRGAGSGKTVLYVPKSLTDIYGPDRSTKTGGYVNWGARRRCWPAAGWLAGGAMRRGALRSRAAPARGGVLPCHEHVTHQVRDLDDNACASPPARLPGAFLTIKGRSNRGKLLAQVVGGADKGSRVVTVSAAGRVPVAASGCSHPACRNNSIGTVLVLG
jgi:hypothetical protein